MLAPLAVVVLLHLFEDPDRLPAVVRSLGSAALWGGTLVLGLLVLAGAAALTSGDRGSPPRELWTAVAVVAYGVMLTSLSGRILTLPLFAGLQGNWQGKILDLLWVGILFLLLRRWAREETGLRGRLVPGSARPALIAITVVLALFVGLGAVAALTGEDAGRAVGMEQIVWDATLPNLTEELIWRGMMLAVLDRALPPSRRVLGAPLGWGAVLTAVVFGLGHMILLGADGSWSLSVGGGLFATAMGLAFAWIRSLTGSIWPAFALHCAPELGADVGVLLGS
ncbi:CPBP family intramembrane glutamic endopeptidase [Brachybacterium sp. YJGR34]|uniref:CPBP family intramembrane glutamic endopeptidase n=1 Tax=Brachybacterium sp. YJGR34 TaxID=2059911 RepID=UPI0013007025|nr:CPBP family intramembrane glutamic endopeptidase [Brachybacterium sp. YJGR34]